VTLKQTRAVWELELSAQEKLLLLAYVEFAHSDGTGIFPAQSKLSKMTGLCVRAVRYMSRRLETKGYLKPDGISPLSTRRWILDLSPRHAMPEAPHAAPGTRMSVPPAPGASELKNLSKNSLKTLTGDKPARLPDGLFDAITDTCQVDPKTAGSSIGKVRATLAKAGYTPEDVAAFKKWWWGTKNMRQRPPGIWELQEKIGVVRQAKTLSQPEEPHEYFVPPYMRSKPRDNPYTPPTRPDRDQVPPGNEADGGPTHPRAEDPRPL
jgi:hypothetical protein